ncbi:hypothetical protein QTO34_000362 [Cnephaeus nilssonii]|uniref:Peptidase A2 domain-containing protein n=1 Tax=Cnephaeus nilssonii TaxID=3371016 RepID=A0AA40IC45_CNENI|nr:hypothetical protein QTO34_000362 [Eptesicus nilssonii]
MSPIEVGVLAGDGASLGGKRFSQWEQKVDCQMKTPRVTLQVGGKPVSFLVDTGAAYSVLTESMGPVTSKKTAVQEATGQIACFP